MPNHSPVADCHVASLGSHPHAALGKVFAVVQFALQLCHFRAQGDHLCTRVHMHACVRAYIRERICACSRTCMHICK